MPGAIKYQTSRKEFSINKFNMFLKFKLSLLLLAILTLSVANGQQKTTNRTKKGLD